MAVNSSRNSPKKRTYEEAMLDANESCGEVCIPIAKSMVTFGIIPYFEDYGEIDSVSLSIRFKDERVAASVLRKPYHKIKNRFFITETFDHQRNAKRPKFNHPNSGDILNLNDMCLMKVFSHLSDIELCNVAGTNVRFEELAKKTFTMKHDTRYYIDTIGSGDNQSNSLNMKIGTILRCFGGLVRSLDVWCGKADQTQINNMFHLASMYCGDQLLELRIMALSLPKGWRFGDVHMHFPKLKHIHLLDVHHMSIDEFDFLLKSNPSIKQLTLSNINQLSQKHFASITKLLPNLEMLCYNTDGMFGDLRFNKAIIKELCELKSLKYLDIHCNERALTKLIAGLWHAAIPIEHLKLTPYSFDGDIGEVVNSLTWLKTLKEIALYQFCSLTSEHLVRFAKSLPLLNKLDLYPHKITIEGLKKLLQFADHLTELCCGFQSKCGFNVIDYEMIVYSIKRRAANKKLTIFIYWDVTGENVDMTGLIDTTTLQNNQKWLEIL